MTREQIIGEYLNSGKTLTLLSKSSKIPIKGVDWTKSQFSKQEILNHDGNLGWVIGDGDLVVDFDPKNYKGHDRFKQIQFELGIKLIPTVITPSGGYHVYLRTDKGLNLRKTMKDKYPGVDFLSKGSFCVIPPSHTIKTENSSEGTYRWYDQDFGCFTQEEAPSELIKLINKGEVIAPGVGINEEIGISDDLTGFEGLIGTSSSWDKSRVLLMLDKLDPSMTNDEWVKVGMALYDWDIIEGLELWEEWSKSGDNYKDGETEKRWRSFDTADSSGNRSGVSLGTISYMVKEVNFDQSKLKVDNYINKIRYADEKSLEFDVCPKIRKESLSDFNKERLAKAIQDRLKILTSVNMPIKSVRNMISNIEVMSGELVSEGVIPNWCKEWVYANSHASFVNMKNLRILKTEAFNLANGKNVPTKDSGSKMSASKFISDNGFVDTVDSMAYLPGINQSIVNIDDMRVLNSFNPKTVPMEASEFTTNGLEAIELIKKHIRFICGNDNDTHIFTQWLAHCVQLPGKQILWSPVIQSVPGVGKSFFGELLRTCLGDKNVGAINPSQVVSDFNGWATNVTVNVLEELRVKGHNRYEAVNSLKPLITDRMIQINDKGVKQYMTYNTANYICFTNYKDSLPLDQDDRRWWILFAPIESLSKLKDYVGETAEVYFPKLFDAVRSHGGEVRKWMLEFPLTKEFLAIKQAPMTSHKLSMIATEELGFDGYSEIKELIEEGNEFYNRKVISYSDLFDDLLMRYPEINLNAREKNNILKKLGYSVLPKQVKINGKVKRFWTKENYDNDQIRAFLDGI